MIKNSYSVDAETDLRITPYLNEAALPAMIRPVMSLAQSDAEKDILLMSLLTAAGSCMPNLYFRYGTTAKQYYPNLQCFIVGSAASGKGIANLALEFVRTVHECSPLIIPGDSTFPAFFRQLESQYGRGYIHESEGSVITDIWRSSTANYNTALRKAAEHEPVSRSRYGEMAVIRCPQVSMLVTGTFSQYHALVPSTENGYFSRLLTLIVDGTTPFSGSYMQPAAYSDSIIQTASMQLYKLYEYLYFARPREFRLTDSQCERLGSHLETAYPTLISMLGSGFHSVVIRMSVHIERMAMILSAMRMAAKVESNRDALLKDNAPLVCLDEDYRTAELTGNKLILHMAQAYQLIKGREPELAPKVKPLDQRQILLSLLPDKFESKELVEEAKSQGIPRRTVLRWNDEWLQAGIVFKIKHGIYRKKAM